MSDEANTYAHGDVSARRGGRRAYESRPNRDKLAAILDMRENRAFAMEGFMGILNCGPEGYK